MDELIEFLDRIKSGKAPTPSSERETENWRVLPVFHSLGWDIGGEEVRPQYATPSGKLVDYCLEVKQHRVFVEVKRAGAELELERSQDQLLEYAYDDKLPALAVITNGERWLFFLPSQTDVPWRDRKFCDIDLARQTADEAAGMFEKYLSKESVSSGRALKEGRRRFREATEEASVREAIKAIPEAWAELVSKPDEFLVEMIAEEAGRICGRPVVTQQIADAIAEFLAGLRAPSEPPTPPPAPTGRKLKAFVFRGKRVEGRTQADMLVEFLRLIHSMHEAEFDQCLKYLNRFGTKKVYLSKGSPDRSMGQARQIPGTAFYVETQLNADLKIKVCRRLLAFFKYEETDLKIEWG